ncbi:MAG: tetratricopeptide repeat protein [Bacteroidia bacterium]|nr:tetratricopeptide repeat protein [Bacteroidia bacterium]
MMRYFILIAVLGLAAIGFACKSSQPAIGEAQPKSNPGFLFEDKLLGKASNIYIDACTEMIKGDYAQATQGFEEVLEINPAYHAAKYNIAKMAVSLRDYDKAIDYGKEALSEDPSNYWYYKVLQEAYQGAGNFSEAVATQEKLVGRFPEKIGQRLVLVSLYLKNSQSEDALRQLREIEAQGQGSKQTGLQQLQILKAMKKYKEAVVTSDKLLEKYPEDVRLIEEKYKLLSLMGKEEEGIELLEKLFASQPDNGLAALRLADYYKKKGELKKSDEYLFKAFENPAVNPNGKLDVIIQLLQFASKEGSDVIPRAKKLIQIYENTHPNSKETNLLEARIFSFENKLDSARQQFLTALENQSTDINIWFELLELDFKIGEARWLYEDAEEALTYYPNQKRILYYYGLGAALRRQWDEAAYAVKKCKRLGADNEFFEKELDYLSKYIDAEVSNSNTPSTSSKTFFTSNKDFPISNLYLGRYYIMLGVLELAVEPLEKFKASKGTIFPDLIEVLVANREFDKAKDYIQEAIGKGETPSMLEVWGDLLFRNGQQNEAEQKWKRAIELGASDIDIKKKLNQ